jgi:hypothetical protein
MASRRGSEPEPPLTPRRRATTPEGRERQLVALANDLAEQQMMAGTASAQVITHYLKLGSTREQLEQERLRAEVELQMAKVTAMAAASRIEELIGEALIAFKSYSGQAPPEAVNFDED